MTQQGLFRKGLYMNKLNRAYAISQHIIFHSEKSEAELWIKVTDYQKGYWAEAPISRQAAMEIIAVIQNCLKEVTA